VSQSVAFAPTLDLSAVLALVIDDEPEVRDATEALLGKWHCQVISAGSSAEMMARLDTVPKVPDLIVCDYRLGGDENGAALVRRLRGEFNSEIPAVLITGQVGLEEAANDPDGALPVLHKPLNPARLRTLIVNLLRQRAQRRRLRIASVSNHSDAACNQHRLRSIDDAQHLEDRRNVRLDRFLGQSQLGSDLLVGLALTQSGQNLELAQREQGNVRLGALARDSTRALRSRSARVGRSVYVARHTDVAFQHLLEDFEQHACLR
jgi:CheY-like chemotaxis protein